MSHLQRVRHLFQEMLTVSQGIRDYNFRHYFLRRTTQDLHLWEKAQDATHHDEVQATERLEELKRI